MNTTTLNIPKRAFIDILKAQPNNILTEIFEQIMLKSDTEPLTIREKEELEEARMEYKKGETIIWKK